VTGPLWGNFVDSGASRKWLLQALLFAMGPNGTYRTVVNGGSCELSYSSYGDQCSRERWGASLQSEFPEHMIDTRNSDVFFLHLCFEHHPTDRNTKSDDPKEVVIQHRKMVMSDSYCMHIMSPTNRLFGRLS
jgi:hypothetical protein